MEIIKITTNKQNKSDKNTHTHKENSVLVYRLVNCMCTFLCFCKLTATTKHNTTMQLLSHVQRDLYSLHHYQKHAWFYALAYTPIPTFKILDFHNNHCFSNTDLLHDFDAISR